MLSLTSVLALSSVLPSTSGFVSRLLNDIIQIHTVILYFTIQYVVIKNVNTEVVAFGTGNLGGGVADNKTLPYKDDNLFYQSLKGRCIEEGFLKKRKPRSSLLFGGHILECHTSHLAARMI